MSGLKIVVPVKIDARLFRDFALFDAFRMKRQFRSPILFASIMTAFAMLCFILRNMSDQAVFMGFFLMTVGLGLPFARFVNYSKSISVQIRRLGLTVPQPVYTVTLTEAPDGIEVVTINGDASQYGWNSVYGVYKAKNCTYLYVQKDRAYFLPDKDVASNAEALRGLLEKKAVNRLYANRF